MYSHLISYVKEVKHLGPVPCQFRTTADALQMHLTALRIAQHAGQVSEVKVEPIQVAA